MIIVDGRGGMAAVMLWEQRVRGDISCFQCRESRVLVGTATGGVHIWSFLSRLASNANHISLADWDGGKVVPDRKPKREKFRAALKTRGRFPKTQGFSNVKGGFGGGGR